MQNLLTAGGASVVYGPSNTGKSFWGLELAASVATGRPFMDSLEVDQGAVIYFALEGIHGARNRIHALRLADVWALNLRSIYALSPCHCRIKRMSNG